MTLTVRFNPDYYTSTRLLLDIRVIYSYYSYS